MPSNMVFLAVIFVLIVREVGGCVCPSCNYDNVAANCQCCVYRVIGKRFSPRFISEPRVPSYSATDPKTRDSDDTPSHIRSLPDFVAFPARSRLAFGKPLVSEVSQGYESKNMLGCGAIHAHVMENFNAKKDTLLAKLSDIARDINNINLSKAVVSSLDDED